MSQACFEALERRDFFAVSFSPAVGYAVPGGPRALAVGDLNGDSVPDLVTANFTGKSVSVLLANGDGTLQARNTYGTNTDGSVVAVTIADFNGDSKPDLATANLSGNDYSVLINNGNGTFGSAATYGVSSQPRDLIAGDFNGDGKRDLAIASQGSSDVSVIMGNGNGTFASGFVAYGVGATPLSVATGDFNRDGKVDLVTANSAGDNVSVLINNGTGVFATAVNYNIGARSGPRSVVVGDLNGDGWQDLATANLGSKNVSVLLNSTGTFQAAINYGAGTSPGGENVPNSIVMGDLDGDLKQDLITANAGTSNSVSVLMGNGNGTFQAALSNFSTGLQADAVARDINQDNRPDLITVYPDTVNVLLNTDPNNAAPAIASNQATVTANEGAVITNTGTFFDSSGQGTVNLTASIGTVVKNANGTWSWTHPARDSSATLIPVTITARDTGGLTSTATFNLSVLNVSPTITSTSVPASRNEGSSFTLTSAATDPAGAGDPLTYTWTVTKPDLTTEMLTGANPAYTPNDSGPYKFTLMVTDGDGGVAVTTPSGLISWYHADGSAADVKGTNAATLNGGVSYVAGKVGQAFSFDGVDDYIRLPDNFMPMPDSGQSNVQMGFSCWFRTSGAGVILGQDGAATGYVPAVYVGHDGRLRAQMFWGNLIDPLVTPASVADGQWHHIAVSHNGTIMGAYLDGHSLGTKTFHQTGYTGPYQYRLGTGHANGWPGITTGPTGAWFPLHGEIDEPAFYSRPVLTAEIQGALSNGIAGGNSITVSVNVAPTPTFSGPGAVLAGQVFGSTVAATDPSPVDQASNFAYSINWGDGGQPETFQRPGSASMINHAYEAPGTYNTSLTAMDKDGDTGTVNRTITVMAINGDFLFDAPKPAVAMTFTSAISEASLAAGDLTLINLTTGQAIDCATASTVSYDATTHTATWQFPGLLADADYRATLKSLSVDVATDSPLSGDYSFDFFARAGDANHDRSVDVADLGILASNWQQSPRTFSQGDFNYDGIVDVVDLGILASAWQQTLRAAASPSTVGPRPSPFAAASAFVAAPVRDLTPLPIAIGIADELPLLGS
jgi:hypothetical protein